MNSAYFNQNAIQKGGDNNDIAMNIIVSHCGCGFDKFKNKLDKYKIPYIDAYQLLFSVIKSRINDKNIVNVCIQTLLDNASKYVSVNIFFSMPIRKDMKCILEDVLYNLVMSLKKTYNRNAAIVYMNFEPLLLFDILSQDLLKPTQLIDIETVFEMFKHYGLILLNTFPLQFTFKNTITSINEHTGKLPDSILEYFKEHIDECIYIKLYRNEHYSLNRIEVENITSSKWYNDFDVLYDDMMKHYIERMPSDAHK